MTDLRYQEGHPMRVSALFQRAPQARIAGASNRQQEQEDAASGSHGMRAVLAIAAALLVISSAGFGAIYAWTMGAHHGQALAVLAVCMALGLELSKPFAVEAVLDCARRLAVGRALAMLVLALVAIGYSLTAELSLMATTRGDAAAGRAKAAASAEDARAQLARIVAERESLVFAPATAGTVTAARESVAAATRMRKAECANGRGPNCRAREADESSARDVLTKAVANKAATDRAATLDARADTIRARLAQEPATAAADPGAAALASVLGMFGIEMAAAALTPWLVLMAVIALEVGSSLAVVLVRSMPAASAGTADELQPSTPQKPAEAPPAAVSVQATDVPAEPGVPASTHASQRQKPSRGQRRRVQAKRGKDAAATKIVDTLRKQGGRAGGSVRRLGDMIGERKSTVHNALAMLVASGVVSRVGAELVLR